MNKIDLNKTTLRELNSKLHQSKENEKWLVTNPKGNHAIAVGLDNFINVGIRKIEKTSVKKIFKFLAKGY